jgi:hypothetical protein
VRIDTDLSGYNFRLIEQYEMVVAAPAFRHRSPRRVNISAETGCSRVVDVKSITLVVPVFGEQTAQACANAC